MSMHDKPLTQRMRELAESHRKYEQGGGASMLLDEGADALEEQWRIAHDEHCSNTQGCTSFGGLKQCSHPRP